MRRLLLVSGLRRPTSESTATYPEWIAAVDGRGIEVGIWVEISGRRVESITEQWVP